MVYNHHKVKNPLSPGFLYNPNEIAFAGYRNSGKTTLITGLINQLAPDYRIGYVKHDAHHFQMDREGKDTFLALKNGATGILIHDAHRYAQIHEGPLDDYGKHLLFLNDDLVFLEGYKDSDIPKIFLVDKDEKILRDFPPQYFKNTIAFVGQQNGIDRLPAGIPYYRRDAVELIRERILHYLRQRQKTIPLWGLILTGGKSTRMKRDKGALEYYGKPHSQYMFELLSHFCKKVYISNRREQADTRGVHGLPQIHDTFQGFGPAGGIVSAMKRYPNVAWLVLACDLPYVDRETINPLIQNRNPFKIATAYISTQDGLPEPLCAIYEPKSRYRFLQFFGLGHYCPRKILISSEIKLLKLQHDLSLKNVNHPEEYEEALAAL